MYSPVPLSIIPSLSTGVPNTNRGVLPDFGLYQLYKSFKPAVWVVRGGEQVLSSERVSELRSLQ